MRTSLNRTDFAAFPIYIYHVDFSTLGKLESTEALAEGVWPNTAST